jgi:hypothetical protein
MDEALRLFLYRLPVPLDDSAPLWDCIISIVIVAYGGRSACLVETADGIEKKVVQDHVCLDEPTDGFCNLPFSIECKTYPGVWKRIQKLEPHDLSYVNKNIEEYQFMEFEAQTFTNGQIKIDRTISPKVRDRNFSHHSNTMETKPQACDLSLRNTCTSV